MRLSHVETKRLLLTSVDASTSPDTAAGTITGGRLNVGTAMRALALVLKERGLPALPGTPTDDAAALQLRQRMMQSPWGQLLLASTAARQPTAAGAAGALAAAGKPGAAATAGKPVKQGAAVKPVKPATAGVAPAGGAGALKAKDLTVGPLDGLAPASPLLAEAPLPAPADEAAAPAPAPTEPAAEAAVQAAVMPPRQHRRLRMASL